ncbi:MAG: hypothetical protein WBP57_08140 [Ignavibacteria bacterium]|jgi:hypothetical protein|nr:MAG: hypothetical protein EDM69_01440 [Chlorobiota bacterium]KXK01644.1 MAG: hypothetical protein UZ04_CHB001002214 [Chlorobi bacterium OLB4]MBV6398667.1 hypothetical protein [Ignavibacteria bacterium]MCE7952045.1 hypothetical protein [Chlorobi bacterium CHB7]OQY77666.1 MAG: hypothetical protein B6D43_03950 [Ignavibacteriales bacterium UTCHB1]RIK48842.1 MAG: hypothetical protein DCC60_06005 [Ignavibacteriota bacterium]
MTKVVLYENGKASEVLIDSTEVYSFSTEMLSGIENVLRLAVDSNYMNEIKSKEKAIEIYFPAHLKVQTNYLGPMEIDRIFIPLSGDLSGTKESPVSTVIISENGNYISTPYRLPNGFSIIEKFTSKLLNE